MAQPRADAVRTIVCAGCGTSVTKQQPSTRRYCSRPCARRFASKPRSRTGETRQCPSCREDFYLPRYRLASASFCSTKCHDEHQGRAKTEHVCKVCASPFRRSPCYTKWRGSQPYCSSACAHKDPDRHAVLRQMNAAQQDGKMTKLEQSGYALLDALGVEYVRQELFQGKFTPDATIPGARVLVQFDGDYWHDRAGTSTEPRIRKRVALDQSQDAYARACGWTVVRVWESDLRRDPTGCAQRLLASL